MAAVPVERSACPGAQRLPPQLLIPEGYPTSGWWKTRPKLDCYDRPVRYALLASIRAPEIDVDPRTQIANRIDVETAIDT